MNYYAEDPLKVRFCLDKLLEGVEESKHGEVMESFKIELASMCSSNCHTYTDKKKGFVVSEIDVFRELDPDKAYEAFRVLDIHREEQGLVPEKRLYQHIEMDIESEEDFGLVQYSITGHLKQKGFELNKVHVDEGKAEYRTQDGREFSIVYKGDNIIRVNIDESSKHLLDLYKAVFDYKHSEERENLEAKLRKP